MEDMAPELLKTIRLAWKKALISDAEYRSLVKKIDEGKATYKEVEDLAYRVGRNLSKALKGNITSDIMPNGHVPLNVSEKILKPTLREAHEVVTKAAMKTQNAMNKAAGIGLKAQTAEFDTEKAHGLVYNLSKGLLKDTGWILDAPVTTFVQSSADRTMEKNVKFQAKAGLHPRITRKAEGKCCKWCSKLEGSYDYGDEPQDIYKRHRNCRCVVDYRPGDGKRQNVWSKEWHEDAQPEVIEARKRRIEELGRKREAEKKRNSSGAASIDSGKRVFYNENADYKVKLPQYSESINVQLSLSARKVAEYGSAHGFEYSAIVDLETGNEVDFGTSKEYNSVNYYYAFLNDHLEGHYAMVHNHNTENGLSLPDMQELTMWENLDSIIAVTNNGITFSVSTNGRRTSEYLFIEFEDVGKGVTDLVEREKKQVKAAVKKYSKGGIFIHDGRSK